MQFHLLQHAWGCFHEAVHDIPREMHHFPTQAYELNAHALKVRRTNGPNEIGDHRSQCFDSQVLMTSMFSRASHLFHCYDASCRYVLKAAAAARTGTTSMSYMCPWPERTRVLFPLPSVRSSDVRLADLRE